MREYELVFLVADNVAEDKQAAVLDKIKKLITDANGSVIKEENLGRRRLAYEIKKNEFATYHVVNFKVEGQELQEIERDIRLTLGILRHLIVLRNVEHISILEEKLEATSEKEIAEAIGGERSVEQVEGETEASYDLMAKREKEGESIILSPESKEENLTDSESSDKKLVEEKTEKPAEENETPAEEVKKPRTKKIIEKVESEETAEGGKVVIPAKAGIQSGSRIKPGMTGKVKTVTKEKVVKEVELKTEKPESKKKTVPEKLKAEDEADRLKKLDDKLADILGDDL